MFIRGREGVERAWDTAERPMQGVEGLVWLLTWSGKLFRELNMALRWSDRVFRGSERVFRGSGKLFRGSDMALRGSGRVFRGQRGC